MKAQKLSIKTTWVFVTMGILSLGLGMPQAQAQVPGVIIDQDMSSDHDDVGDLAVLCALANLGECQILACMTDSTNGGTPLCQNAICTYYGMPNVPCGIRPDSGGLGGYPATIASEFPHPLYATYTQCPLAVNLYRQILASQPDHSVVIVTTGYLNNLEALLQSPADQYSSLTGSALVAKKVKILSCAGGQYPTGGEFNFTVEPAASSYTINNWPAPAIYTGYEVGGLILSGGALQATSTNNPVRRAWELTFWGPYPTWGQQAVYNGVRAAESAILWNQNNVGYNTVASNGVNTWDSTGTAGQYNQAYILDKVRWPIQEAINTLIRALPNTGGSSAPSQPSDVRATVVSSSAINLQWTDNSYNETGFKIERGINGVYTQVGTVGANVTTYSDTGLSSTANVSYRVKATNSVGDSAYSYIWVYSGWTETNFQNGTQLPLYTYYQTCDLRAADAPAGGASATLNNHVTVNNDSTHGQDVTIKVDVSGTGAQGSFYIYFFYQSPTNWYRLNVGASSSKFEKSVNGTISQIGSAGAGVGIGAGQMQLWQVLVSHTGTLQFLTDWATNENVSPQSTAILNVSDTLSFTTGKIGLGGTGSTPVWQNFNFNSLTGVASPPASPTGLAATPGNNQVNLSWTAVPGATSYNIYQAPDADGESATPIANVATTSYANTGLTNGTSYFYKVAAVSSVGLSSYSYEVSATPGTTISTLVPNGTYEITPQSTGMAITTNGSATAPSVVQEPYTSATTQQWTLTNLGNNVVELVCVGNNQALEVPGATPVNGAYLDTSTYLGGSYQLWQLVSAGTGYYQIVNLNSSLGANVAFNSTSAGVGIVQYAVSNAANSVFAFTSVNVGTTAPAAPTGLTATAGNAQVGLSWTASSGATSYNVYRGSTAGGESTTALVTSITTTSYTNTGLTNGTAYYYEVAAVNTHGTSGYSNEAHATPAVATYALSVNSGTGSGSYTAGTQVTVTANAAPSGQQFAGWTGATSALANASSASTTLTMPAAATAITATYSTVGGGGGGGSTLVPDGTYEIAAQRSSLPMAATGLSNGSAVQQQTYTGAATQQWTLTNLGNNVVKLVVSGTSEALEVPGSSTTLAATLDVSTYTGGTNQQWTLVAGSTGFYELVNVNSGLEVNVSYNSLASGVALCQYTTGNYPNGVWSFTPAGGGVTSMPPSTDTPTMPPWGQAVLATLFVMIAARSLPKPARH